MTLRTLSVMAQARKRHEGELAAWHVAQIVARLPFTAVALDPTAINPYRGAPAPHREPTESEVRLRRRQWRGLVQGMIDASKARRGG